MHRISVAEVVRLLARHPYQQIVIRKKSDDFCYTLFGYGSARSRNCLKVFPNTEVTKWVAGVVHRRWEAPRSCDVEWFFFTVRHRTIWGLPIRSTPSHPISTGYYCLFIDLLIRAKTGSYFGTIP